MELSLASRVAKELKLATLLLLLLLLLLLDDGVVNWTSAGSAKLIVLNIESVLSAEELSLGAVINVSGNMLG